MVSTLTDEKRMAIAVRLADIKALHNLVIDTEEKLMTSIEDAEIRRWLSEMLNDDRKNMSILENVIINYGTKAEPKPQVQEMINKTRQLMEGSKLTPYEKISQHELLKHQLAMAGIEVHKAAQVVGADIDAAIAPLNTVNFENRAHQERLKGVREILSTRELTGKDPDQSIFARIQDTIAAATGVIGSVMSRGDHGPDMKVTDYVRMDHNKVNMLFTQIMGTDEPGKITEYFGQLYKDLTVHAEAEEQTWYPALRQFGDAQMNVEEAWRDQDQFQGLLEDIKRTGVTAPDFKSKIQTLMQEVQAHVSYEENQLFARLREHYNDDQLVELGRQFQSAKSRIQDTLLQNK